MDSAFLLAQNLSSNEKQIFLAQYTSRKKSVAAGVLLALFLGGIGAHKFYLGEVGAGVAYIMANLISWMLVFVYIGVLGLIALSVLILIDACMMGSTVSQINSRIASEIVKEIEFTK
jgi:TM2 domain-containing membrane protein YozV